ncbi:hypothetical protein FQN57_000773 [Myotisia sp. PD_48]|nr:hypothetical protein FQN57_000773 [Myotisia sp. PD_48]
MCWRIYRKYACCYKQRTVGWKECEDSPPGMKCPKAQEYDWNEPYAICKGYFDQPCWDCMWAKHNDGGEAKRKFIQEFGKRQPDEDPWVSDEERKDKKMVNEERDWYWIIKQKKQRSQKARESEKKRVKSSDGEKGQDGVDEGVFQMDN